MRTDRAGRGEGRGKVILLGEHVVVHGRPALAAALEGGATATARPAEAMALSIAPWGVRVSSAGEDPLARAFGSLLEAMGVRDPVSVEASVAVPSGAGLGSSAALGVAVLRAIDHLLETTRTDDELHELALTWERVFHGNPSGIDTAMALAGGVARYVREPGPGEKRLVPVTPRRPLRLVIGESGEGASTKAMVEEVARQHRRSPEKTEKVFDAVGSIVETGRAAIERGDLRALGQLFDMNQGFLASLMVSTAELEEMCAAARAAGALGAKLTGGGGGGCMIALVEDEAKEAAVTEALSKIGRKSRPFVIGRAESGAS